MRRIGWWLTMSDLPATLTVTTSDRPPTLRGTLDPLSFQAEELWLPVIGPSAYLLGQRLVRDARQDILLHDREELGFSLGMRGKLLPKAVERLEYFNLALRTGNGSITIFDPWPIPRPPRRH